MNYEWDDNKLALNLANHKVDFALAEYFEWEKALIQPDLRKDYGELRYQVYSVIENRVYCLVYTVRETHIRLISLRKANQREVTAYVAYINHFTN
jgi:uncharacterized protein